MRRELPKAKERLRHKKHVIFGCIRQPGFEEERDKIGKPWRDHGLVFCTQVGTPLNRNNIHTRSFKSLVERAGLPPPCASTTVRHTFATLMLKGGEHPKVVQEMMGHATINITLDTYSHVLPDMQDKAADRLGALLS